MHIILGLHVYKTSNNVYYKWYPFNLSVFDCDYIVKRLKQFLGKILMGLKAAYFKINLAYTVYPKKT